MSNIFKNINKKIIIWYKAQFMGYAYWRVIYGPETESSEGITEFKFKSNAKTFAEESGGKAFIDYAFVIKIQQDSK